MATTTKGRPRKGPAGRARGPAGRRGKHAGRRRWWAAAGAVVVLVALVVVASARGGDDPPAATGAGSGEVTTRIVLASAGGSAVGDPAPAFEARTTAGTSFALPAGKPAVLFFMAGWCATCFPEATALENLNEELGDRVAILGVSPDPSDSLAAIRDFAGQAGASYGFVHDGDGTLAQALGVRSLDTTVIVDGDGRIVWRDSVPTSEAALRDALAQAGVV